MTAALLKVTVKKVGTKARTYPFQTVLKASQYAQKYVGTTPGLDEVDGEVFAVAQDGSCRVKVQGCSLIGLFPELDLRKEQERQEEEMAKQAAKKQEETKVESKVIESESGVDARRAFTVLAGLIWQPEDMPDIAEMSDDVCETELRDNIQSLTPEDKETVLKEEEDGEEVWSFFESVRKDLNAAVKQAEVEKVAETKGAPEKKKGGRPTATKPPAEPKGPSKTKQLMELICNMYVDGKDLTFETVKAELAKKDITMADATVTMWITDSRNIMGYLASIGALSIKKSK